MTLTKQQIRARKKATTPAGVKRKVERGEAHGNERAYVRVGKMNTKIMTGQEDLSVWSDEELKRGQRKDKNGRWQGRPPSIVPKAIHDEMVRRTMEKAATMMNDNLEAAVACLVDIVKGADVEDKDRIKAASMIIDRVMGRTPEKVELTAQVKPWQTAVQGGIVRVPRSALPAADEEDIIDVDEVED